MLPTRAPFLEVHKRPYYSSLARMGSHDTLIYREPGKVIVYWNQITISVSKEEGGDCMVNHGQLCHTLGLKDDL